MLITGVAALIAGCASPVQVTPLATGQPTVQAFELRGSDPNKVRAEASRLCDGSGEVLRDSHQGVEPGLSGGRLQRWMQQAGDFFSTSDREAQLVVRCATRPDRDRLTAWLPPPASATPATQSDAVSKATTSTAASATKSRSNGKSRTAKAIDADVPYGY